MIESYAALREPIALPRDAVALLPLGAMETHGPHLPLGTDGLIAEGIVDAAAARSDVRARVLRLPLVWLGASAEHAHRAGTLSTEPEALIDGVVAMAEGLHRSGLRRIVMLNSHGGNIPALRIAALKLRTRFEMLAASVYWLDFGLPPDLRPPAPVREDVHGGWIETSVMLHLAPTLVDRGAARSQPPRTPTPMLSPIGPIHWGWRSDDLGGSWTGRPDLADATLGARLVAHAAAQLAALLNELGGATWPGA